MTRRLSSAAQLCLLVSLVVGGGSWHLWLSARLDELRARTGQLALARASVLRAEEMQGRLPALTREIALRAHAPSAALPPDAPAAVSRLVSAVTRAAATAGAQVTHLAPRAPVVQPTLIVVPVDVVIEGSFPALVQVFTTLDAERLSLLLTRVRISAADGPASADGLRVASITAAALATVGGAE